MIIATWVLFVGCMILTVTAAFIAIANNRRSLVNRFLGLFLLACVGWSSGSVLQSPVFPAEINILIVRFTFFSAMFMAYFMYKFVDALIAAHRRSRSKSMYTVIAVLVAALCWTPYVVSGVHVQGGYTSPVREPLYALIVGVILAFLVVSIARVTQYYISLRPSKVRSQVQLVTIGLVAGTVFGLVTNVILPNIAPELYSSRFAWVPAAIWTASLAYAVMRHGFLDIRSIVLRSSGYILSAIAAVGAYYAFAALVSYQFGALRRIDSKDMMINSALIIVVSLLFAPLKKFFDTMTNRVFNRGRYSGEEFYGQLTDRIARLDSLPAMSQAAVEMISNTLRPRVVTIYVQTGANYEVASIPEGAVMSNQEFKDFLEYMPKAGGPYLEYDTYDHPNTQDERLAHRYHYTMVFPLNGQDGTIGLLCIGELASRGYSVQDRSLLRTVADEVSITTEKLLSIEKVRKFNEELKHQIHDATKELRDSNQKLIEMDATKDEFVSMASHQLRTPLTSIKGYISMVLEGDAGKISAQQRQLLSEAFASSERMVHLIGDFLNVSRLQTGKFMIDRHETDLVKLIGQEVESMRPVAETHDVLINFSKPSVMPLLYVDDGKLRQVVMNFLDNAVYYSPDTTAINVRLAVEEGSVIFEVIDQGMGVPKEVQKHLFTKFFRAENARRQRPDGTGIGLYLAKKVIDAHGGSVIFRSKLGKGSVFGFRLPIKKLSLPPEDNSEDLK